MKPKFKVGDFIFCEHELQQITEMKDDKIAGVSNGCISMYSNSLNDECFELSLRNKNISNEFHKVYKDLHKLNARSLNYPDLCRYLVVKWCECVEAKDEDIRQKYEELYQWYKEIEDTINESRKRTVDGVRVYR